MTRSLYVDAERFVGWLEKRVVSDGRGNNTDELSGKPRDRFWLGRLATESAARALAATDRILRLDPCAVGFTFQPKSEPPYRWNAALTCRVWRAEGKGADRRWRKSPAVCAAVSIKIESNSPQSYVFGRTEIQEAFKAIGDDHHLGRLEVECHADVERPAFTITVINETPETHSLDENFYEICLEVTVGTLDPFILDSIADSFRYDRSIPAYGINCGVELRDDRLITTDFVAADKRRPVYWDDRLGPEIELPFQALQDDPVPLLERFIQALETWLAKEWDPAKLDRRAISEHWSAEMLAEATVQAKLAREEVDRCRSGLRTLGRSEVLKAFKVMNSAFKHSGGPKYDRWRPFQIGFLLSSLPGILGDDQAQRAEVSTLWFATGGGKTETYLAAVVFSAIYDRLTGKSCGLTAWSRFPLRMLSLQQTQRFADALAGAELARRSAGIGGDPISLGYFVGNGGTPNKIRFDPKPNEVDAADEGMPRRYRVLLHCPFCRSEDLQMSFDELTWRLQHECKNPNCSWPEEALPFYVVDEEIFRFLPTVVVGTLDKAASVALQAAMRGFYAAPSGKCTGPSHGFTYAARSASPNGCLVPDCTYDRGALPLDAALFAPRLRIQDELHLLADSLGAIDSHYETLLDHLTTEAGGEIPKILASSATLAGFVTQVKTLYDRDGKAFPMPGPEDGRSFWSIDTDRMMRRYVALAPRGQTQEFANERIAESVQLAIREIAAEPTKAAEAIGVAESSIPALLDFYGVHVVYGSKLRDVDGAARTFESSPPADPTNVVMLTGSTALAEVLSVLRRLSQPESNLEDRIHVVCASSMMSHGVDIDRFNVMTMIGMPLKTAEFIQTSARIGRRMPGLVFVLHRMAVERDAKIYRSFSMFVKHGDRLIEPIAITRNSRRVLARTAPGIFLGDVLGLYEPAWIAEGNKPLTMANIFRKFVRSRRDFSISELESMADALRVSILSGTPMELALRGFMDQVMWNINDTASNARFTGDLVPGRVLISLRDVEERVPVREAFD